MKKLLLLFLVFSGFTYLSAQNKSSVFTTNKSDQPRNPVVERMKFVPNEVIVKFKDAVPVQPGARMKTAGISKVDNLLKSYGVTSLDKLFPSEQKQLSTKMMRSPQGKEFKIPALDKIYKICVPPAATKSNAPDAIFELIKALKAQPEVEYAEPNYIYSIDAMKPVSEIMSAEEVLKNQPDNSNSTKASYLPNDPLFGQQWYIPAVKADAVWQQSIGESTQIIAILDTGVDWNHPDLKNKIWVNPNPVTTKGADGILNDIRGWDFINKDNDPMDDNSHGTHVAGIAAAETNNGIGIAGICPNARIMPIKVFQSSGQGDVATIAKGINYAATHGATVINMSFGSYSRSLAMEDALANAYTTCVLVSSAGNDDLSLEGCFPSGQFFPAALSYVLGVQSPEASFSNYDCNGPTFSNTPDLLNYEMKAPGTNILSTVPNGNYRVFQGTSMAAPIVSGIAALYRSVKPNESQEMIFGNLINSIGNYVDIQKALTVVPTPQLGIVTYAVADTLDGDKDGRTDVGETIELRVTVRNTWGLATDVKAGLTFKELEDQTTATILTPEVPVGSISAYATGSNVIPLKFKISKDLVDGRDINFVLKTWYGDHQGQTSQDITIKIENGIELKGVIDCDKTLYADKQYIITDNLAVDKGATLTIKPGTTLKFAENKSLVILGKVIAYGTPDSVITFTKRDLFSSWAGIMTDNSGKLKMKYGKISYCGLVEGYENYVLNDNYELGFSFENTLFTNNFGAIKSNRAIFKNNVFTGNSMYTGIITDTYYSHISNNNFCHNKQSYKDGDASPIIDGLSSPDSLIQNSIFNNPGLNNIDKSIFILTNYFQISSFAPNYFGTTNDDIVNAGIFDFGEWGTRPMINIKNKLNQPSNVNHGLVWKVVVNGKDAQDEFNQLDPLGVGKQKFEVYFNRAMDINYPPTVTMGVQTPFSQTVIAENAVWSADSTVYTVYKNVGLTTGDGINTIRVTGAKDMDHFEIPIEDRRFRVVVGTANLSSLEFKADAGLGKVSLEWNNSKLADGLGYNLYRQENINDTQLTLPVLINKTLIADTLYTDFAVTPNKKYYYYYKIVRTNLTETDPSKVVSAIPYTATKGDANGDLSVNVLDITSIVAYLLNNNPQPFILAAADVNSDNNINVLDIVGVVNLVLHGPQNVKGMAKEQEASLYMENDTLFADTNVPVGGIQFDLSGVTSMDEMTALPVLGGFESGYTATETGLRLLYYSMSGKNIPAGTHIPLLVMKSGSKIVNAVFGGTNGSPIKVNFILTRIGDISNNMNQTMAELGQNFPNPLTGQTSIPVHIYEAVDEAVVRIVNMMGQEVGIMRLSNPIIGEHLLSWDAGMNRGMFIYKLEIRTNNQKQICPAKKMIVQ